MSLFLDFLQHIDDAALGRGVRLDVSLGHIQGLVAGQLLDVSE